MNVPKTKMLISCAVTVQLICAFDLAYIQKDRFTGPMVHWFLVLL